MNLIYIERGSVEANFSLHGCKTANSTYFKNVSGVCALSLRCPVYGVIHVVTKNQS